MNKKRGASERGGEWWRGGSPQEVLSRHKQKTYLRLAALILNSAVFVGEEEEKK